MNILCVSDTTQSLAFSPNVKEIYKDTDIILSCGDMPVESYDYLSTMLRRDVFYVYGNHNLSTFKYEMDREYRESKFENINGSIAPLNEFLKLTGNGRK